jgi:SNF2 family DNA or RNA helicase
MPNREDMHDYQNVAVEFIKENPFCALWLSMGLGKSVSAGTAVRDLLWDFEVSRCLIIAPKRVAMTTWPMEFRKWPHMNDLRIQVITGDKNERIRAILKKADVHIVSRDNVDWLQKTVGAKWPWDMVIVDESSSFKNQSSGRWKALRIARRRITRMVQLSATPAPNGLQDLWSQMYLLDLGHRLGASEKDYKQRWFIADKSGYGVVPRDHSEGEIHEKVADMVISMKAEDYLDMPDLVMNRVEVDMEPAVYKKYKQFEKDMLIQLQGITVEADNAASLVGKLLQCANGAIYTDVTKNWELLHDEKIEALKEIVETHAGYPIMVAYNFKSDLQRLRKAFPKAVVMDDNIETQDRWNNGEIPMLLTHPASSGHGLNLQGGSHIIVWFGLNWSLELYQQLLGRLYRQGQKSKTVVVHHIVAKGTVDERVLRVIESKEATQTALLDAVKTQVQ